MCPHRPTPPDIPAIGAFELTGELLGRGGFADVWAARHQATGWRVAVKRPRPDTAPQLAESLVIEARALARIQHPAVVRILDVFEGGDIVMERAESTAALEPPSTWRELRDLLIGVLDALAEVHSHGLVHRDVKPSNVLLGVRREPREPIASPADGLRLADFGIAVEELEPDLWPMAGSRSFRAPEQRGGARDSLGPWTDLFAVGRVAQELSTHLEAVPADLDAWIRWLTADRAADRPDRAVVASEALLALGPARATLTMGHAGPRCTPQDTTRVHSEPIMAPARVSPPTGAATGVRRLPRDWRTPVAPWPGVQLLDAGAGLQQLRVPRVVGQHDLRDRLWSALHSVAEHGHPRVLSLRGPLGIGRRALARWLGRRAHAVGAADVERVHGRHAWLERGVPAGRLSRRPEERVLLVLGLDLASIDVVAGAMQRASGPILAVMTRGTHGESWPVPPLPESAMRDLARQSLSLAPQLSDHLVERARGVPGAAQAWLQAWARDGQLVATPDGYTHTGGARPVVRTRSLEGPYAAFHRQLERGEANAAWRAYASMPATTSLTSTPSNDHLALGFELLDTLGAGPDDVRRLRLEMQRERAAGVDQAGQWRRMEALCTRARRAGDANLHDQCQMQLAQWQYTRHGDAEGARRRLAAVRERVMARQDTELMCLAHIKSVWPSTLVGRHEEALQLAERASELAETARDFLPYAHMMRARVFSGLGRHDEAASSCREGLQALRDGQDSYEAHLLVALGGSLLSANAVRESVDAYGQALAVIVENGWLELEGVCHTNMGWALFDLARLDEAEHHLRAAVDRYRGTNRSDTSARVALSVVALDRGDLQAARAMLDGVEVRDTLNLEMMALAACMAQAWYACCAGDADAWPARLSPSFEGPSSSFPPLVTLARKTVYAARQAGWPDRAGIIEGWWSLDL